MVLKKSTKIKNTSVKDNRLPELKTKLQYNEQKIRSLLEENEDIRKEILSIQILPFKIGDYAMAEVVAGKTRKVQKCLLECESGTLYVRPVKDNGELSGRHFSVCPVNKSYSDILKPVEE